MRKVVTYTEFSLTEIDIKHILMEYVARKAHVSENDIINFTWKIHELGNDGYQGSLSYPTGYEFRGCAIQIEGVHEWDRDA